EYEDRRRGDARVMEGARDRSQSGHARGDQDDPSHRLNGGRTPPAPTSPPASAARPRRPCPPPSPANRATRPPRPPPPRSARRSRAPLGAGRPGRDDRLADGLLELAVAGPVEPGLDRLR